MDGRGRGRADGIDTHGGGFCAIRNSHSMHGVACHAVKPNLVCDFLHGHVELTDSETIVGNVRKQRKKTHTKYFPSFLVKSFQFPSDWDRIGSHSQSACVWKWLWHPRCCFCFSFNPHPLLGVDDIGFLRLLSVRVSMASQFGIYRRHQNNQWKLLVSNHNRGHHPGRSRGIMTRRSSSSSQL